MDLGKKPPKRKKVRKVSKYDRANIRVINGTYDLLDELFARLIEQVARIYAELPRPTDIDPDNLPPPFKLTENPLQAVQVEAITKELGVMLERAIERGIEQVQEISDQHLRDLVTKHLGKDYDLTPHLQKRATAVAKRKQERFYSERVWKSMEQVKSNIETAIDLAIVEGRSADQLSRDLREFLNQPDKLFRRVRDKRGVLHLSENARAYQPGMGVYRSSYKNARRLAGTEINRAYRTADHERWKELDMVVGIRVSLSNNHTCVDSKGIPRPFYDICDELEGDYPKDFKFTAWHPNCRCIATPILKTPEELRKDRQRIRNGLPPAKGSKNEVKELPDNFKEWQARNAERIARAEERGTTPHFLRDNQHLLGGAGGGGKGNPPTLHGTPPEDPERRRKRIIQQARERQANRTPEETQRIQKAWLKRNRIRSTEEAEKALLGNTAINPTMGVPIGFTAKGIKEAINQPHSNLVEKNKAVKRAKSLIEKGKYTGDAKDRKGRGWHFHYIDAKIGEVDSQVIIRQIGSKYEFYSIAEKRKAR